MKQKTLLNYCLLLLCLIVGGVSPAWGADETITFSNLYSSNTTLDGTAITGTDFSITFNKRNGGTATQYYTNGTAVRWYGGGTMVVASSTKTIEKIEITFTQEANSISTNVGSYSSGTWTGSASSVTFTQSGTSGHCRISAVAVTYAAGTSLENSNLALTNAPVALSFDLYNNKTSQVVNYTTSSTGAVTVSENDYVTTTVNTENKTITVEPKTSVTPSAQTITVSQAADDTYKAGTATFTVTITDSTPIPTHTATFSVNGVTSTEDFEEGAAIEFPEDIADVSGKSFVGWVTTAIVGTTNAAPDFVTSATMGQADITYYAVFADVTPGTQVTKTDVLTTSTFGSPNNYTNWSGKSATDGSSAVYAGNSTTYSDEAIQIRATTPSGIVSTTSGGKVTKIVVDWNSGTISGRTLDVYGWNTAYTGSSQLYSATGKDDVELGSIVYGTSTELNVSEDYQYIGLRSHSGAMYLNSISITWVTSTPDAYSDYCTTVVAAVVAKPQITVAENPFLFFTTATITCETEGASIYYRYSEEDDWSEYTTALNITATTTIYAKAVKGEDESTVAQVTATKNLAEPTVTIDATGITNTNVFDGTAAGSLLANVTYNDEAIEGAEVTWSGNNDAVATIDEDGVVTLVAAGSVTFTATYAGNGDYSEKAATYEMTVTNTDPNAPGTENNPYTVAEAIAFINSLGSSTSTEEVYVDGIISQIDSYNSKYSSITYWISDDGTTTNQMEVYSGKGLDGADFSSQADLSVGDIVTVKGYVKMYNTIPEFTQNNQLVNHVRKPSITATPSPLAVPNYVAGTADPTYETLTVSGSNLTADITLTLDENSKFEMSTDLESWSNSVILAQSEGNVTNGEVAVRLKAGLAKDDYTGSITLSSTNADNVVVNLTGSVTGQTYTITVDNDVTGGSIEADVATAEQGDIVTLTATPDAAYTFGSWTVYEEDMETEVAVTDNQFTMPACGVYVTATFNAKPTYAVTCTVSPAEGGMMEVSPATAYEGQTVTLSYVAESGYILQSIVITKTADGSVTDITPVASGNDFTFAMPDYAVTATATFEETPTYTLATSITPGKHYIIVGKNNDAVKAMGAQNSNNRAAVDVTEAANTITSVTGISEFVIYGPDASGYYTIYDATEQGYLYAASSSSNYLRTQTTNDANGKWSISIDGDGVASVVAQGNYSRNVMQYNSSSSIFSCYGSASQKAVYLYEKEGDVAPASFGVKLAASGYASYCSQYALDLTPTETYAAWAVTAVNDATVTFTKITGAVPAETPFILYGKDMGGETISLPVATGATTAVENNKLKGTLVATEVGQVEGEYTNFALSDGAFKKIAAGVVPANKAYLPVLTADLPSGGEARLMITFDDGTTTGIVNLDTVSDNRYYNLRGQRVENPVKGGLYIVNGRKVVVK